MLLVFLGVLLLSHEYSAAMVDRSDAGTGRPGQQPHTALRVVALVLIPQSNSPALDLMGVAAHLQARWGTKCTQGLTNSTWSQNECQHPHSNLLGQCSWCLTNAAVQGSQCACYHHLASSIWLP